MSEFPALLDWLKQKARGLAAHIRPAHLAAAGAVVAIGAGVAGLAAVALPGPRPVLDGGRIRIQVFDPVEPEIRSGEVMDVGALVDGFEYTPPPRPEADPAAYAPYDEDFDPPKSRSTSRASDDQPVIRAPPQPRAWTDDRRDSRDDRADRWFGFDAPERDYRAEREARRARRDAREQRERERDWRRDQDGYRDQDRREARRYSSGGPDDDWD